MENKSLQPTSRESRLIQHLVAVYCFMVCMWQCVQFCPAMCTNLLHHLWKKLLNSVVRG